MAPGGMGVGKQTEREPAARRVARKLSRWREMYQGHAVVGVKVVPRHQLLAEEVAGELALVREAGERGHLRQGQVRACLQELLGPLDAAV